jgi:hypothetical protein
VTLAATILSDFWDHQLVEHDKQAVFLVLAGFILSFAFIRLSTRLMRSPRVPWWPGSIVSEGGLHLHHLVFGIGTMIAAGTVGFALIGESPGFEICAALFGIGAGLTIDEFALWVHLDDVYWSREGRSSIDATVIAAAAMGLIVVGARPFSIDSNTTLDVVYGVAGAVLVFAAVAACFGKQRLLHGAIGFFVLPVALYGSIRLGKPSSPWARRFYGERRPDKQEQAAARFRPDRRTERVKERFRDLVGGEPSVPDEPGAEPQS